MKAERRRGEEIRRQQQALDRQAELSRQAEIQRQQAILRQQEEIRRQEEMRRQEEIRRQQEAIRMQQEAQARQSFDDHMAKGQGFVNNNQFDAAIQHFDEALQIYPHDIMAKMNKAVCYEKKHDFKTAFDLFTSLAGYAQQIPNFQNHLSHCEDELINISTKLFEEAQKDYEAGSLLEAKNKASMPPTKSTTEKSAIL